MVLRNIPQLVLADKPQMSRRLDPNRPYNGFKGELFFDEPIRLVCASGVRGRGSSLAGIYEGVPAELRKWAPW
jgi:hypothetical protein